jgi:hypothetical protein
MAAVMDAALKEIEEAVETLTPQYKGLLDYSHIDLQPGTLAEINVSIVEYQQRLQLLHNAKVAIDALVADGHPEMKPREVEASVHSDLQENKLTIDAAFGQFTSNAPVSLAMSSGAPESKPKK